MKELNLFHELCKTTIDDEDRIIEQEQKHGITASHLVNIGGSALSKLFQIADVVTIDRCLEKLRKERKKCARENQ
ncbi:hypothetical protein LCGC14_1663900 [marine sediment metagenome]|uniref:Uncharacterized protein n=1 Tax=marine sediment metagenome TaxID=412755 RepID=A0A0F9K957_9ZZZZ